MRLCLILPAIATALLVASTAAAQATPASNAGAAQSAEADDSNDADVDPNSYAARKKWTVGASFETDRSVLQEDVGGRIKAFNSLSFNAGYSITQAFRASVSWGIIQRFIADETETGIRGDDIGVSASYSFKLPWKLGLTPSVGNSFPTSFNSQLMGLIALPRASLSLSRSFLDGDLNVGIRGGGAYYVVKYKEATGLEDPNTEWSTNVGANVSYQMPFHRQLSVSASASTAFSRAYDVDHANDPTIAAQFANTPVEPSADPYFAHPSWQQSYGYEVDLAYQLPSLVGVQSTFQLAFSQGDGVLRDGATHLYWASRRGSSFSASLTVSY
jgi:hypothetical protein